MLVLDSRGLTPGASETHGGWETSLAGSLDPWRLSIRAREAPVGATNFPIRVTINQVRRETKTAPASRPYGVLTLDVIDAMTPVAMLKASWSIPRMSCRWAM